MIKNTAGQKIGAQMITAADGTIFTGAVTVYVTGDAGTQALGSVGSGVCVNEGNGYSTYAPAQAETNYSLVAFTFIGTGAISTTVQVFTQIVQQTVDNDTKLSTLITGVDLNADAIKAGSYDESTAFPLTAVNGSTLTEAGGTGDQFTGLPEVVTDAASRTASKATGFATPTNITAGTITTVTTNTDLVTAAAIKTAMEADGGDLSSLIEALVNKRIWAEASGDLEMFNDAGVSQGTVTAQVTSDGTFTKAERAFK